MTQLYYSWEYTQRSLSLATEMLVHPCSCLHWVQSKKEPEPPIVEQIKEMWYRFTVGFYSAQRRKKNKIMAFARKIRNWKIFC